MANNTQVFMWLELHIYALISVPEKLNSDTVKLVCNDHLYNKI